MRPKFVLNEGNIVGVRVVIMGNYLELVTDKDHFLVSIDMSDGSVTVNENPTYGLKYKHSIR